MDKNEPEKIDRSEVETTGANSLVVAHKSGETEVVAIRQATLRTVNQLNAIISSGDLAARMEWFCSRPKGWSDTLEEVDQDRIFEKGNQLNFPILQRLHSLNQKEIGVATPALTN